MGRASRARRRPNPAPRKPGTAVATRPKAEVVVPTQVIPSRQPPVLVQTYGEPTAEKVLTSFDQYVELAYAGNAVIFGLLNTYLRLFSEARLCWRDLDDLKLTYKPGDGLEKLRQPWPNGFTGDMLARMCQDASIAGNAYVRDCGDRLERLRPDWVTIVSWVNTDMFGHQVREVIGYMYDATGDSERSPEWYPVEEVAHWAPIPDPIANFRGMSWFTPALREINADRAMTEHREKFWRNSATPNLIIKYSGKIKPEQKIGLAESIAAKHGGPDKAGGTLVLDEGADLDIVGSKLSDAQFSEVLAQTENRMAVAAGVPALLAGLKEGLDAAAWSMYRQAMRAFADLRVRPDWRSACAALSVLVDVPEGHELWYDTRDIAALQESETESATRMQVVASTLSTLVTTGFTKESSVLAVSSGDETKLVDSGLVSVQLLKPGEDPKADEPPADSGKAKDEPEAERAVVTALIAELSRSREATEQVLTRAMDLIERNWGPEQATASFDIVEADELVQLLAKMETGSRSQLERHLPGLHNQKDHGRRRNKDLTPSVPGTAAKMRKRADELLSNMPADADERRRVHQEVGGLVLDADRVDADARKGILGALAKMREAPKSGDRERVDAILGPMSHKELDAVATEFDIPFVKGTKEQKRHRLGVALVGARLDRDAIMNVDMGTGQPKTTREEAEAAFNQIRKTREAPGKAARQAGSTEPKRGIMFDEAGPSVRSEMADMGAAELIEALKVVTAADGPKVRGALENRSKAELIEIAQAFPATVVKPRGRSRAAIMDDLYGGTVGFRERAAAIGVHRSLTDDGGQLARAGYNEGQLRDHQGKWTDAPGGGTAIPSALDWLTDDDGPGETPAGDMEPQDAMWGKAKANSEGADTPEVAAVRAVFEGDYAGFNVRDTEIEVDGDQIEVSGSIYDASGRFVGEFDRAIQRDRRSGDLFAYHSAMELDRSVQGQGFAQAFNASLFDWYHRTGVKRVELHANLDVGGYAWARAGYDWKSEAATSNVRVSLRQISELGTEMIPAERLDEQKRLATQMLDRFNTAKFGDIDYPTPYEVSQLGRWPGAGKDDWWIGKRSMIGVGWDAVRHL